MASKHPCPCCGNKTIEIPDFYEICPICGWEDDPGQNENPDDDVGANHNSLNEAREAYQNSQSKTSE